MRNAIWSSRIVILVVVCLEGATLSVRTANAQNRPNALQNSGTSSVSRDLLDLYGTTTDARTIDEFDAIFQACASVVQDSRRSRADREYARELLAWSANKRGEARCDAAALLVETGKREEAAFLDAASIEDFRIALQHDPKRWKARHNLAIGLALQRKYSEAVDQFSQVIRESPKYANAYFNRGEIYFTLKELDLAIADFSAAAQLDPKDASSFSSRAHARFLLEQYDASIADYVRATELQPANADFRIDLADAFQSLGRWEEAAEQYGIALEKQSEHTRGLQNAAWLLATCPDREIRDAETAIALANRSIELEQKPTYRHWDTLAAALASAGQYADAVATESKALKSAPSTERSELEERLSLFRNRRAYIQDLDSESQSGTVVERNREGSVTRTKVATRASHPSATGTLPVGTGLRRSR